MNANERELGKGSPFPERRRQGSCVPGVMAEFALLVHSISGSPDLCRSLGTRPLRLQCDRGMAGGQGFAAALTASELGRFALMSADENVGVDRRFFERGIRHPVEGSCLAC
jgi:hypothetical protein